MNKHWRYLKYILRHKWYVMLECFRLGLYWRGIIHDLSKFLPSEWFPYVDYFYSDKEKTIKIQHDFDVAWLKHQKRNPHHWQYWILHEDNGTTKYLLIPVQYFAEMIADWRGMSRTFGKSREEAWNFYQKYREQIKLHPDTRRVVEAFLRVQS